MLGHPGNLTITLYKQQRIIVGRQGIVVSILIIKLLLSQKLIKLPPLPGFEPGTSLVASRHANH